MTMFEAAVSDADKTDDPVPISTSWIGGVTTGVTHLSPVIEDMSLEQIQSSAFL